MRGPGGSGPLHFNFRNKEGPKISVSNRDIAFYGCSDIIRTRNFAIFTVHATIEFLDNLWQLFIFSNYIREKRSLYVGSSEKVQYL